MRIASALGIIIWMLSAGACSNRHAPEPQLGRTQLVSPSAAPELPLPAPSSLLGRIAPGKAASYVNADLVRPGEGYASGLPHQRVSATAGGALFAPAEPGPSPAFAGLAFAMYAFSLPGYDAEPSLTCSWNGAPTGDSVYIGLANWSTDAWDFFAPASEKIVVPELDPYFVFNGGLLACVVRTGTATSELDSLRIGSQLPTVSIEVSAAYGSVGETFTFTAAGADPDGTVAEYRWDPEGDGSFLHSTGPNPVLDWIYALPGDHRPAVLVLDASGMRSDPASAAVAIYDGLAVTLSSPGASVRVNSAQLLPDGHLLLFISYAENLRYFCGVAGIGPGAAPDFASRWTGSNYQDRFESSAAGPDGAFYACGSSSADGALVQKWSTQGELLWSRATDLDLADDEIWEAITVAEGSIWVCGSARPGAGVWWATVARLDMDGQLLWCKAVENTSSLAEFTDLMVTFNPTTLETDLHCVGLYTHGVSGQHAMHCRFGLAGGLDLARRWGPSGIVVQGDIVVRSSGAPAWDTLIAGTVDDGDNYVFHTLGGTETELRMTGAELEAVHLEHGPDGFLLTLEVDDPLPEKLTAAVARLSDSSVLLGADIMSSPSASLLFPAGGFPLGAAGYCIYGLGDLDELDPAPLALSQVPSATSWVTFSAADITPAADQQSTHVFVDQLDGLQLGGSDDVGFVYMP